MRIRAKKEPEKPKRVLYPNEGTYISETKDAMLDGIDRDDLVSEPQYPEHNTCYVQFKNGTEALRFHRTSIISTKPNGDLIIDDGGFGTSQKTRDRIMRYGREFGLDITVYQTDGTVMYYLNGDKDNPKEWPITERTKMYPKGHAILIVSHQLLNGANFPKKRLLNRTFPKTKETVKASKSPAPKMEPQKQIIASKKGRKDIEL
jgi:hypothetical protein